MQFPSSFLKNCTNKITLQKNVCDQIYCQYERDGKSFFESTKRFSDSAVQIRLIQSAKLQEQGKAGKENIEKKRKASGGSSHNKRKYK